MAKARVGRQPPAGRGNDLRLADEGVLGSGLELDGALQLTAFGGGALLRPLGRVARPARRRAA